MNIFRAVTILSCAFILSFFASGCATSPSKKIISSVVRVTNLADQSYGTGFVVSGRTGNKYIATNAHVCASPQSILLWVDQAGEHDGLPALMDKAFDLCLIPAASTILDPLEVSEHADKQGSYAIGYPGGEGPIVSPVSTFIFGTTPACADTRTCYLFKGHVRPGSSGSPIVTSNGLVTCIVNAVALNDKGEFSEVGVCIPSDRLHNHLQLL